MGDLFFKEPKYLVTHENIPSFDKKDKIVDNQLKFKKFDKGFLWF